MRRYKLFTMVNVASLALSMSVAMLLIAMIFSLLKFDQFHANKDRIYRVLSEVNDPSRSTDMKATAPFPLAERLQTVSSVENTVRIRKGLSDAVVQGNSEVLLSGYFTDPSFTTVFSFPFLAGNPDRCLVEPFSIVLTQTAAMKLFNTVDVLGKTVSFRQLGTYTITGVMTDVPRHSHLLFEALVSFSTVPILEAQPDTNGQSGVLYETTNHWDRFYSSYVYVLLKPGANPSDLTETLDAFQHEAYPHADAIRADFSLQPLLSIVPGPDLSAEIGTKMIYLTLVILGAIALLILVAACFNYANLSIARALQRAKEVGLRKLSGATTRQIILQFTLESVAIALVSLIIALTVYDAIVPHVMENSPRAHELFDLRISPALFTAFLLFAVVTGFLAGIVPAVAIARLKTVESLKQLKNIRLMGRSGIRGALVVFQFTISLFLFTALVIINSQYRYALNKDLGFDKNNVLVVPLQGRDAGITSNLISQLPDVTSVDASSDIPGTASVRSELIVYHDGLDSLVVAAMAVSAGFVNNFEFDLVAGRLFDETEGGPADDVVVNEQFVALLDDSLAHNLLDKSFNWNGNDMRIVGVVKDFHYTQLENSIEPFFFVNDPSQFRFLHVKIQSANIQETRNQINQLWNQQGSERAFEGKFLNDHLEETYQFYMRLMRVFGYIGLVAMAIALLGLMGMVAYSTERRTKEIGIRKVLGARVSHLLLLLSRSFTFMLLLAAGLALPAAYFLFDLVVLNVGAYRIEIGWLEMSIGLSVLLVCGFAVVLTQCLRVSLANPVKALRDD